jgi:hypothetical protein
MITNIKGACWKFAIDFCDVDCQFGQADEQ